MHLGEISFCDKIGVNVKADDFKKDILVHLQSKYNISIIQKHYNNYNSASLHHIRNKPHVFTIRSNGNPYFLFLTKVHNVNTCIFIDKKVQHGYTYPRMILQKMWFDDIVFAH